MAWYCYYLNAAQHTCLYSWCVILLLGFEIIYIIYRAANGQLSHFNTSSSFASTMYALMGLAATVVTLWTAYLGVIFFQKDFPELPIHYVWAIRFGIILFVIFSLEGFLMGSRMAHSIGGPDGGPGIPILNWSKKIGDARVAHFFGMHALQLLPLVSYYVFKNTKSVIVFAVAYGFLSVVLLIQALSGKPFVK